MRIYIAGPYTKPDPIVNVRNAIEAADQLVRWGYAPFVPHLTMLWHLVSPKPLEDWYAIDLMWLEACDAVLRLPGESVGADRECERARQLGLPVYTDLAELR